MCRATNNIAMVKATTTIDTSCITDGPQESELEDSYIITKLVSNRQNKTVVKDVAQKTLKFYFTNTSSSTAVFSSATDGSNKLLFRSQCAKFSVSVQLGSLTVKEILRSTVLHNRLLREYLR